MARYLIPLTAEPQSFTIALGGREYRLTLRWGTAPEGGWLLDVAEAEGGTILVAGMALVTGVDLLAAHAHLGFGGMLWVYSPDDLPPSEADLGTRTVLIFEVPE